MRWIACLIFFLSITMPAEEPSAEDLQARLRMARQLAREMNDRDLVARVERLARANATDEKVRAVEKLVGIDPGGWAVAGQPLFHPTTEIVLRTPELGPKLGAAMLTNDPAQVKAVVDEMKRVLGDQAGVPDGRRPGVKPTGLKASPEEATHFFLDALQGESRKVKQLMEGKPLPDQMLRLYGSLLSGVCEIRPMVNLYASKEVRNLDRLVAGLVSILMKAQQPEGHFPFPDLRGKNIRFGDMITRQVTNAGAQVRDGWVISPDPDGGSQFDTAVCGVALIQAGAFFDKQPWKEAGLRAADWAVKQPCCANFNYNAFSVWLLAEAYRATKNPGYLDAALKKLRVGVAPGQASNGRWLDAHNARTVYHVIILRSLAALGTALPASMKAELDEVNAITLAATKALIDEFDAMGVTVDALPELVAVSELKLPEPRLRKTIESAASVLIQKSKRGDHVIMNMALPALTKVW